jgi:hypothetical protein
MIDEMMQELSAAMRYNPDLSVTEVIKVATEFAYPTRTNIHYDHISKKKVKHTLSNPDILNALRLYNNSRQKDAVRYRREMENV